MESYLKPPRICNLQHTNGNILSVNTNKKVWFYNLCNRRIVIGFLPKTRQLWCSTSKKSFKINSNLLVFYIYYRVSFLLTSINLIHIMKNLFLKIKFMTINFEVIFLKISFFQLTLTSNSYEWSLVYLDLFFLQEVFWMSSTQK